MKTKIFTFFTIFYCLFISLNSLHSQVAYNPQIDSIVNLITLQSLSMLNRELTGDTSTIIGSLPFTIVSRYWATTSNEKAAEFIFERFQSYGLDTRYQTYRTNGVNIIAKKIGSKYPNQQYIICGHYDDLPSGPIAPGADDNSSGTCAVIEAARVLSSFNFDYTLIFIAFDEEEIGLYGSKAYSDSAFANQDSIVGVINLDMIAYDSNNDWKIHIITNNNSILLANDMMAASYYYQPNLVPFLYLVTKEYMTTLKYINDLGSDHISFWNNGFVAITPHEHYGDFNAFYHTVNDKFSNLNVPYYLSMTKAVVGLFASLGWDYRIDFTHMPIENGLDTSAKIATSVINSPYQVATGSNAPRLYYKIGSGQFSALNAFYNHLDTFKFLIPGQPLGKTVSYYIAAQDSLGNMVGSLPAGARGINPPGTIPPQNLFTYRILKQFNPCSNTVPKNLPPGQMSYDSINIIQSGSIFDYDLNLTIHHTNDEDLYIYLTRPGSQIQLSTNNGGTGDNYINTTFDDEASIPITQGTPPFTGSFRPQQPLSTYDTMSMQGTWTLKIFNASSTISGQLVNWCLNIEYYDPVSVVNNQIPVTINLSQNYPNPFNSKTKIKYSLSKTSEVRIVVYDILGREISTLVNGNQTAGNYVAVFSSNYLSSGMYYYSMFIDGELFGSKKMVIIK